MKRFFAENKKRPHISCGSENAPHVSSDSLPFSGDDFEAEFSRMLGVLSPSDLLPYEDFPEDPFSPEKDSGQCPVKTMQKGSPGKRRLLPYIAACLCIVILSCCLIYFEEVSAAVKKFFQFSPETGITETDTSPVLFFYCEEDTRDISGFSFCLEHMFWQEGTLTADFLVTPSDALSADSAIPLLEHLQLILVFSEPAREQTAIFDKYEYQYNGDGSAIKLRTVSQWEPDSEKAQYLKEGFEHCSLSFPGFDSSFQGSLLPLEAYASLSEIAAGTAAEGPATLAVLAEETQEGILLELFSHYADSRLQICNPFLSTFSVPAAKGICLKTDEKTYTDYRILNSGNMTQDSRIQVLFAVPKEERRSAYTLMIPQVYLMETGEASLVTLHPPLLGSGRTSVRIPFAKGHAVITKATYKGRGLPGLPAADNNASYLFLSVQRYPSEPDLELISFSAFLPDPGEKETTDPLSAGMTLLYTQPSVPSSGPLTGLYLPWDQKLSQTELCLCFPVYRWNQRFEIPIHLSSLQNDISAE